MTLKYELQSIISGAGRDSKANPIEAAAYYLRQSEEAGGDTQANEFSKDQEAKKLKDWIQTSNLWFDKVDETRFIARGAEQRVYLAENVLYVIKLNDSIFYERWLDYFHNLLIHNFLFPQTAYELIGFYLENKVLHAVVKRPFIEITEPTDTSVVKEFYRPMGFS